MFDTILLPTDGSDAIERVVAIARDIATRRDATVHVLYVVDDRAFLTLDPEMRDDVLGDLEATGRSAVAKTASAFEDETVVTAIEQGNPAEEILAYVDAHDIDLVTMGTHGDAFEQNILGSVSQRVVARSNVPVMTINVAERE